MKRTLLLFFLIISIASQAQTLHEVRGTVQDTTGATLPGTVVKLISVSDTLATAVNVDGVFIFPKVKSAEFNLTVSLIGFRPLNRRYLQQPQNPETINVGVIKLRTALNQLKGVTIVGTNPVRIKEDTVEFSAGAYKVRENAPTEDMIRKLPGVDVDKDGNITDRGKSVTKIRINGKDFMGGDVKSVTKNLPADVIENIQMIDDYGDQANLTGVKTGEPDRIMNITIRKDRNVGYSLQATAGDGRDALPNTNSASVDPTPTNPAAINNNENHNRYLGTVNYFSFKGDRQISVLGNINNTNINTFTYGGGGVARGGGGGFGGGGGGRGNALRGASTTTNQNGITDAHAIGLNFRDQWGKKLSVYGSYSFSDNLVSTISNSYQQGINAGQTNSVLQSSTQSSRNVNHRLTWNMEYRPDTVNYFKFTPTYSYGSVNTNADGTFSSFREEIANVAYRQFSTDISKSPSIGATLLYNHKFPGRRNLSINLTANSAKTDESDNPTTLYSPGSPTASPKFQLINTNSRTNSFGTNVSFLQPIGKVSYLEFNYNLNHSYTTSDKRTDTITATNQDIFYQRFSNNYNYTFTTNKVGLNYRVIEPKYNFTVGLGLQPAVLDGYSPTTSQSTHVSTLNFAPVAHFNYNFSKTQAINLNYNGSSSQPNFNYLQPVIDFSNALYPVQGNPNLIPEFNNNLNLRYNRFSFATGDILFTNLSFNQTNNKIVANSIQYPTVDPLNPTLAGTYLTRYQNADGYYSSSLFGAYSKPWASRRYTLTFNANANYTNNIGYSSRITYNATSNTETLLSEKNVAKSLIVTPGIRFRTDITDIIDAELNTSYSINTINNSIISTTFQNTVARTLSLGLNGKNYLWKNYTVSYDYTKLIYNGYTGVKQVNPNILNAYVERRFLKGNAATIRIAAYDLFNQNTGYTYTPNNGAAGYTVSNVNRLGRYYLLSFSLRLQKFAGKAPQQDDFRGRREGGGEGRPGGGGPPGGGPPMD